MVTAASSDPSDAGEDDIAYYEQLQDRSPAERPSRRRRRAYQRRADRHVVVHAERRDTPDVVRMSKALLSAQRELARLQAESDARTEPAEEQP